MSHKILDNDLVAIRKSKVSLTLIKPACVGMCILDFSKVLMYEFRYECIKTEYDDKSRILFTDTDSSIYEIKLEMSVKRLEKIKKCFVFVIIHLSQYVMMIQTI